MMSHFNHASLQPHWERSLRLRHPLLLLIVSSLCIGALSACADEESSVSSVGGRAPLAGEPSDPQGLEPYAALPTPPPDEPMTGGAELSVGGQDEGPPPSLAVDLSAWGLIPPSDEPAEGGARPTAPELSSCELPELPFPVAHPFAEGEAAPRPEERGGQRLESARVYPIAHPQLSATAARQKAELVIPSFSDDMPLFERAEAWSEERCYELRPGEGGLLSEGEAFERYRRLVASTLWRSLDERPERRSVIGIRGASPGMISWNHNSPNLYNDTLALLWRDAEGRPQVREFPVNTDTGVHDFGEDSSSSLRPNRHYPYVNGWHRDYNALRIDLASYPVRDDTNNNGHWDSDRNGWLAGPEGGLDYDRLGTAHNIHGAPAAAPLATTEINMASAGCQVIPGAQNWERFIQQTWTEEGDSVDYYLIDARDIPQSFFEPCQEDGTHDCPYSIRAFPYSASDDTAMSTERRFDRYSCAEANEGGTERVYVVNLPSAGIFRAMVETATSSVDPDLHLLDGGDAQACRARAHEALEEQLPPGRYVLVIDSYVNGAGEELSGPYELLVEWIPTP